MGNSANANIIYGFIFAGEGCESGFDDDSYNEDPEEWLAKFQGLTEPDGTYETNKAEWEEYWKAQRSLPINTICDGDLSSGTTTDYLCIQESVLGGDWGGPTNIPVDHIKPPPDEWDTLLREFCEKAGVPFVQPGWILIVNYG